jgi:hypothetical protein
MKRTSLGISMTTLAALLAAGGLAACNTRPITVPGESPTQATPQRFSQSLNNKADILFMIDNSPSMAPMQNSLITYFPNFMQPFKDLTTLPDLHIGIVSSDMGAGRFTNVPGCRVGGDQGMLQNQPRHPTKCGTGTGQGQLKNSSDRYLTYAPNPQGGAPLANFNGDVGDAFACYADLGDQGCGFEYQLGSPQAALNGCGTDSGCTVKVNEGFFRSDAYLAIILLTNEDDSSAPGDTDLWDPSQTSINSDLGPLTSYRQFEFGNLCDGHPPGRQTATFQSCVPNNWDTSDNLHHQEIMPEDFASFFKGLKPADARYVYVSAITGPTTPVAVATDSKTGYPVLQPSCSGGTAGASWTAVPSTHLYALVNLFDTDRASFISICDQDLNKALKQVADELAKILGAQCLSSPLADSNGDPTDGLQPDCVVYDQTPTDTPGVNTTSVIPACDEMICTDTPANCKCKAHTLPDGADGCWFLYADDAQCSPFLSTATDTPTSIGSGYQIKIDRGFTGSCTPNPAPDNTTAVIQCASCIANPKESSYDCSANCKPHWPDCCPDDGSEPAPGCVTNANFVTTW